MLLVCAFREGLDLQASYNWYTVSGDMSGLSVAPHSLMFAAVRLPLAPIKHRVPCWPPTRCALASYEPTADTPAAGIAGRGLLLQLLQLLPQSPVRRKDVLMRIPVCRAVHPIASCVHIRLSVIQTAFYVSPGAKAAASIYQAASSTENLSIHFQMWCQLLLSAAVHIGCRPVYTSKLRPYHFCEQRSIDATQTMEFGLTSLRGSFPALHRLHYQ